MRSFYDRILSFVPKEQAAIASGEISDRGGLSYCGGRYKLDRILIAAEFSLQRYPGDLVEIGVLGGGTTIKLAKLAHRYGRHIIAVDPWIPEKGRGGCTETTRSEFMKRMRKYLHMTDVLHDLSQSKKVINFIKARSLSFAYIDGAHYYEPCGADIETVWHCAGIIALDDLWMEGVKRAFVEAGEHSDKDALYHDVLAEGYLLPTERKEMLTIFTTPAPFVGKANIHQRNAIRSFQLLTDDVLVFKGDQHITEKLGACHVPSVSCNSIGLPYIGSLFGTAELGAKYNLMVYANADTILMSDLLLAVASAAERFDRFLLVGQRRDVDLDVPLTFGPFWEAELREYALAHGELHSVSGKDWMAFRRPLGLDFPPFVVARPMWDNWTLDMCLRLGVPVIDATADVTAIHPNHAVAKGRLDGPWAKHNNETGKVKANKGRISEATHTMIAGNIIRKDGR